MSLLLLCPAAVGAGGAVAVLLAARALRRTPAAAPAAPRRLPNQSRHRRGAATVAALAIASIVPAAAVPAVALVAVIWMRPRLVAARANSRAIATAISEQPEVIDLFALAVGAGYNIRLAVEVVAARAPPLFAAALSAALIDTVRHRRLVDALEHITGPTAEVARPLVAALASAERYGAPLGDALERLAADARLDRRRRAEAAARRVPVQLLFPLVLCVLPAFALLSVVPLLIGTLRSLRI
jgi:tight adherence protein C